MKSRSGRILALLTVFIALSAAGWSALSLQRNLQDQPDLILRPATPFIMAAGVPNRSQRLRLGADQSKDRWIRGFEFVPGDPRVIVSAFFYIEKTGQWLGAWGPGQPKVVEFPQTVAAFLPAGSNVVVEINYRSIEADAEDLSSLGLYFLDRKPLRPLTAVGVESPVEVPSNGETFQLQKEFTVISDSYALGMRPEMKTFGQSFEVMAIDPAGTSQSLLVVKDFRSDVQNAYMFEQPYFIGQGTRIIAKGYYKNDSSLLGDDVFKLTMNLYSSDEFRPTSYDAPARAVPKKRVVKKAPAPKKPAPAKKPPQKRPDW